MTRKREHIVYRYRLKETGEIIYVGKTNSSLKSRIDAHAKEEKFSPYKGKWEIDFIILANFVETDVVEKFLINKWKPVLNDKDCVSYKTNSLSIILPNWQPYSSYHPSKHIKYAALYKEAKAKEHLAAALWTKDKAKVMILPSSSFKIPYGCCNIQCQVIKPEISASIYGFEVEASVDWICHREDAKKYPNRFKTAIWEEIAQNFPFSNEDSEVLVRLEKAQILVSELEIYCEDGFDQGHGFDKGVFETSNWEDTFLEFGFQDLITELIADNEKLNYLMEIPPFEKNKLGIILENIAKTKLEIYKRNFLTI